jgi:hypothetical protein
MLSRPVLAIFLTATFFIFTAMLSLPLAAQMRGGVVTAGAGVTSGGGTAGAGSHAGAAGAGHGHHGHSSGRHSTLFPYFYDYADYGYDNQEPAPLAAAPAAVTTVREPPAAPAESLLIEWQGDHFARTTLSQKVSDGEPIAPDYSEQAHPEKSRLRSPGLSTRAAVAQTPRELPPAVLVFRDGRHEEISSYTIMSGTIYSKADYWTSGSWTKKIQLADLDVSATLKLNHENGLNFVLPAGPNEVVVGP